MTSPSGLESWLIERSNVRAVTNYAFLMQGRVLDIGCGEKPYEPLLVRASEYVGLEHPATLHGRNKVDVWGDAHDLPFGAAVFDSVCSFHVLEHTAHPVRVLQEAFRVLRPGGALLLLVPFMWGVHESPHDYFRFTPFGIKQLLRESEFTNVVVEPLCGSWATSALRLSYMLARFGRGPVRLPILLLCSWVQIIGFVLDRLDPSYNDAAGYVVAARRSDVMMVEH